MIARDGSNQSLWQTAEPYTPKPGQESIRQFDVAVVGGGITGVTLARMLQLAGTTRN